MGALWAALEVHPLSRPRVPDPQCLAGVSQVVLFSGDTGARLPWLDEFAQARATRQGDHYGGPAISALQAVACEDGTSKLAWMNGHTLVVCDPLTAEVRGAQMCC
jgi:hypothetical protein